MVLVALVMPVLVVQRMMVLVVHVMRVQVGLAEIVQQYAGSNKLEELVIIVIVRLVGTVFCFCKGVQVLSASNYYRYEM
jgi:hypothetical protein